MKTTDVYIIADLSESMRGNKERIQTEMVQALIKQFAAEEPAGQYRVCIIGARGTLGWGQLQGPLVGPATLASQLGNAEVVNLTRCAGTNTALRDAIGAAFERIDAKTIGQMPEAILVSIFSDGEENCSTAWSAERLKQRIAAYDTMGNVTITFAGPKSAGGYLGQLGLPAGNFRPWDGTVADLPAMVADTVTSTQSYTTSRAAGVRKSTSFYADPTKLNTAAVRGYAKQVTPTEVRAVSKTMAGRSIADFFKKFEPGKHYYQLVKPEYIQEDKDLVVHIKDQNEYRQGSRTIRMLLGLPEQGKIRVRPGPHSDKFDIYVQSSSVNRKLVEGQQMLTLP